MGCLLSCFGACRRIIKDYRVVDDLYSIDEAGFLIDVVADLEHLTLASVKQRFLEHSRHVVFFSLMIPDFGDELFVASVMERLLDKCGVTSVKQIKADGVEALVCDELTRQVLFHFVKDLEFERRETKCIDVFIHCGIVDGSDIPQGYFIVEQLTIAKIGLSVITKRY